MVKFCGILSEKLAFAYITHRKNIKDRYSRQEARRNGQVPSKADTGFDDAEGWQKDVNESDPGRPEAVPKLTSGLHCKKEKPYRCMVSRRPLSSLRQRLYRHTDIINYKCDVCGSAFITQNEFGDHLRYVHISERPQKYVCDKNIKDKYSRYEAPRNCLAPSNADAASYDTESCRTDVNEIDRRGTESVPRDTSKLRCKR